MSKPTLFFSKRCPHSGDVLNRLQSGGPQLVNMFQYVCIDGNRNLPPFLRSVPTLVVPGHGQPMTGEAVFMWVDTQLRARQSGGGQRPQMPLQQSQGPPSGQPKPEGAMETSMDGLDFYNATDMSGFGDSYMSLDGNDLQEHCFNYIDENGNEQRKCVPAGQMPQGQQGSGGPQGPPGVKVPDWLKPQSVGKDNNQPVAPMSYQQMSMPSVGGGGQNAQQFLRSQQVQRGGISSKPQYDPNAFGSTQQSMSQQNNIRLQQNARQLPQMPQFTDPQHSMQNSGNKVSDQDFERFMAARNSDPSIGSSHQRF